MWKLHSKNARLLDCIGHGFLEGIAAKCSSLKFASGPNGTEAKRVPWVPDFLSTFAQGACAATHNTQTPPIAKQAFILKVGFSELANVCCDVVLSVHHTVLEHKVYEKVKFRIAERAKYEDMTTQSLIKHLKEELSCTVAFGSSKASLVNKIMTLFDECHATDS